MKEEFSAFYRIATYLVFVLFAFIEGEGSISTFKIVGLVFLAVILVFFNKIQHWILEKSGQIGKE